MESKVYIGGLSYETSEKTLGDLFSQAGTVKSVHIATDRDTGRSRGFGFVEFNTPEEMDNAIQMFNGKEVDGRTLTVNQARPREERGGGGQRGSFGGGNRGGFSGGDRRGGNPGGRNWGNSAPVDRRGKSGGSGGRQP
jgi:RNA recognition motif-containing protein